MKKSLRSLIVPLALFSLAVFAAPGSVGAQSTPVSPISMSPAQAVISSGGSVKLNFYFPSNATKATLHLLCSNDGSISTHTSPELCNGAAIDVTSNTDWTVMLFNSGSETKGVIAVYSVETSDGSKYSTQSAIAVQLAATCPPGYVCTAPSSINVSYPNGGESYLSSGTIPFSGKTNYPPKQLEVYLYSSVNGNVATIHPSIAENSLEFSGAFSGDPGIATGQYKITACDLGVDSLVTPGKPLCDSSDEYFTVVASTSTPPITPCYTFSTNLQLGSRGADVIALQNFLIAKGFKIGDLSQGKGSDKGYFGGSTLQALKKYQSSVGIEATGYFGAITRAKVNMDCSGTTPVNGSIAVVSPNGGESWQQGSMKSITWSSKDSAGSRVNIYADLAQPANVVCIKAPCVAGSTLIAENVRNSGVYPWSVGNANVKGGLANGSYYVRICSSNNKNNCDSSDASFSLVSPVSSFVTTVLNPKAGEVLKAGFQYKIVWTTGSLDKDALFDIIQFGDNGKDMVAEGLTTSQANCTGVNFTGKGGPLYTCIAGWTPQYASSKAQLAVSKRDTSEIGYSGSFSISGSGSGNTQPGTITVTVPTSGSVFDNGPQQNIIVGWTDYKGSFEYYKVSLYNTIANVGGIISPAISAQSNGYTTTSASIKNYIQNLSGKVAPDSGYYFTVSAIKNDAAGEGSVAQGDSGQFSIPSVATPPNVPYTINVITRLNGKVLTVAEANGCVASVRNATGVSNTAGCVRTLTSQPAGTYTVQWLNGYPAGADATKLPTVSPVRFLGERPAGENPITFYIDFAAKSAVSTGQISASLDASSPSARTVQLSSTAETDNVVLSVFNLKSQNVDSYLRTLRVNIGTNMPLQSIFSDLKVRIGSLTYSADALVSPTTFSNLAVSLPKDQAVQVIVSGKVVKNINNALDGARASASLIANAANIMAEDSAHTSIPVAYSSLIGSEATFASAGSSAVSNAPAPSALQAAAIWTVVKSYFGF